MEQRSLGNVVNRVQEALNRLRSGSYLSERDTSGLDPSSNGPPGGYVNYQSQNASAYQPQQKYAFNANRDREIPGSWRPSSGWDTPSERRMDTTNRPDDNFQGMGRPVPNGSYQGMNRPDSSNYNTLPGNYGSGLREETRRRVMVMDDMDDSDRGGIKKMKSNFGEAIISAVEGMGIANRLQSRDFHSFERLKHDLGEAVVSAMKNMPSMTESLLMIEEMKNELFQVTHAGLKHSQRLLKREIDTLEGDLATELDKQKSAIYDSNLTSPKRRYDQFPSPECRYDRFPSPERRYDRFPNPERRYTDSNLTNPERRYDSQLTNPEHRSDRFPTNYDYDRTVAKTPTLSQPSEPLYASSQVSRNYEPPRIPRNGPTLFRNPIYRPKNDNQPSKKERERKRSPLPVKKSDIIWKNFTPEKKKKTQPDLPKKVPDEIAWLVFDPYTLPKDCNIPPPKDRIIRPAVHPTGINPCRKPGKISGRYPICTPYSKHFYFYRYSQKKKIPVPLIAQKQEWLKVCKYDPLTWEEWPRVLEFWNRLKEEFLNGTIKQVEASEEIESSKRHNLVTGESKTSKAASQNEPEIKKEKYDIFLEDEIDC